MYINLLMLNLKKCRMCLRGLVLLLSWQNYPGTLGIWKSSKSNDNLKYFRHRWIGWIRRPMTSLLRSRAWQVAGSVQLVVPFTQVIVPFLPKVWRSHVAAITWIVTRDEILLLPESVDEFLASLFLLNWNVPRQGLDWLKACMILLCSFCHLILEI